MVEVRGRSRPSLETPHRRRASPTAVRRPLTALLPSPGFEARRWRSSHLNLRLRHRDATASEVEVRGRSRPSLETPAPTQGVSHRRTTPTHRAAAPHRVSRLVAGLLAPQPPVPAGRTPTHRPAAPHRVSRLVAGLLAPQPPVPGPAPYDEHSPRCPTSPGFEARRWRSSHLNLRRRRNDEAPRSGRDRGACGCGTPDRIRTGATALRGRRARPLHNGGLMVLAAALAAIGTLAKPLDSDQIPGLHTAGDPGLAGILGLEPRLTGPEPVVLPITPYPKGDGPLAEPVGGPSRAEQKPYTRASRAAKTAGSVRRLRPISRATHHARAR